MLELYPLNAENARWFAVGSKPGSCSEPPRRILAPLFHFVPTIVPANRFLSLSMSICPQEINNIKVLSILFHLVLLVPPAMSAILSLSCLPSILKGQCHEICISIIFPAKLSYLGSWLASWSCFEYCLDFACITNTDLEKIVPRSGSNSPWIKSQIQMSATHCWLHVFE